MVDPPIPIPRVLVSCLGEYFYVLSRYLVSRQGVSPRVSVVGLFLGRVWIADVAVVIGALECNGFKG